MHHLCSGGTEERFSLTESLLKSRDYQNEPHPMLMHNATASGYSIVQSLSFLPLEEAIHEQTARYITVISLTVSTETLDRPIHLDQ